MPARVFDNSDDEGPAPVVQALTEFTASTIEAEIESVPLVIERIPNTFRTQKKYVPNALGKHIRADGKSIAELEAAERSRNNVYGLSKTAVKSSHTASERLPSLESQGVSRVGLGEAKTDEERAMQELLDPSDDKPDVVIDRLVGNELFTKNSSHPEMSSLADYEAVPVEAFGLAMLRGMGYDPSLESLKTKEKEKTRRPDFLGLGATERPEDSKNAEELAKKKFQKRKEERNYVPVVKVNRRTGEIVTDDNTTKGREVQLTTNVTAQNKRGEEPSGARPKTEEDRSRSDRSHRTSSRHYEDDRHSRSDRDRRSGRDDRSRYSYRSRSRSPRRDSSRDRHRSSRHESERRHRSSGEDRHREHRSSRDDSRRAAR